jgi:hypothetical protein
MPSLRGLRGRLGTAVAALCVAAAAGCGTDSGVTSDRADSVATEVAASSPATTGSPQTSPSTLPRDSTGPTDPTDPTDPTGSTDATGSTDPTGSTDATGSTASSGLDTTSEGAKPMLSLVVLDGSDVAADDVDADDLLSSTSTGMLFLTNSQLVIAGLVGGRDEVVIERVGTDGTVGDATRVDEDFEAILGTDRVLFGHIDGVPAMVVTLF